LERKRILRRGLSITLVLFGAACILPQLQAAHDAALDTLRARAGQLEKDRQWEKAVEAYEQLLVKERGLPGLREHYLQCLRHARLAGRHRDPTYRQQILTLNLARALDLYEEVLGELRANHVDRAKVNPTRLFREGLEELQLALQDETFCQTHLAGARPEALRDFQAHLREVYADKAPRSVREARALVRDVAQDAHRTLRLKSTVAVLEFACGACDVLDEYTALLTPAQLNDFYASVDGALVGVGLDLLAENGGLVIAQLVPGGPAALADAGLKPGDHVLRIDRRSTRDLSPEVAGELLRGEVGSAVEIEVLRPGEMMPRSVKLVRQTINLPSVLVAQLLEPSTGIGYVQLAGFQKTTLQELDESIARLRMEGMKVLILDLRGNPGGLFNVAVQVAERFLSEGVIVSTQSPVPAFNKIHEAHNMIALTFPLVVLVDGDTASAAEIVAGALKENQRGTLVGQPTFGKGTSQRVLRLETAPAGVRITLARFFSPTGQAYSGRGVTPHILVDRPGPELPMDLSRDRQLQRALEVASQLVAIRR
jgi:carboxyl-terminal processing protease